ncbi:type II toxin-antitoxin system death-on-curing family toxin [Patescibacteria group bacterium]|nr:type II toxin-antitoxin system death-on-curing family toxin [Patescibacteria group bacterium]
MSKPRTKYLTIIEVKHISHALAKKLMEWDEPIPDFSTRFPNVLEKCLAAPRQTFRGELYRGLISKAAILFYLLIKNHPFQNGNKRIAVTTVLVFLLKNGRWLKVDNQELYNFSRWVAESDPTVKDAVVDAIEKKFGDHLVKM